MNNVNFRYSLLKSFFGLFLERMQGVFLQIFVGRGITQKEQSSRNIPPYLL